MKRFKLHGNTAYWNGLKIKSLNLKNLNEEETSPIPDGKRMWVNVVDSLYWDKENRKEILTGEISDTDKETILGKLHNSVPNFLLTLDGKVIGYANLHNRHGYKDTTTEDEEEVIDLEIDDIVGDDFCVRIPKKEKTFLITQRITITITDEVTAEDEESAREKARDLQSNADDFIYEWYTDEGAYTSDYESTCEEI